MPWIPVVNESESLNSFSSLSPVKGADKLLQQSYPPSSHLKLTTYGLSAQTNQFFYESSEIRIFARSTDLLFTECEIYWGARVARRDLDS